MWLALPKNAAPTQPAPAHRAAAAELPPSVAHLPPAEAVVLLGNWNYDRKRWPEAIDRYVEAIRLGADNPDVRTDLGNAFRFSNQPQKALAQYAIAQQQNPQHQNSLFNTAGLHAEVLHNQARAAELWREFLRRFPDSPAAAQVRQFLAMKAPEPERQKRALEEWLVKESSHPAAR